MTGGARAPLEAEAILRERARALAEPRAEAGSPPPLQLLVTAGTLRLAIPAARVREVLAPGAVAALPGRRHNLAGLRWTRHGALPVADCCVLAGEPALEPRRAAVVVLAGREPLGLLAEAVEAADSPVDPARTPLPPDAGVPGTVRADGVIELDVDALLDDPRLEAAPTPEAHRPHGGIT